MACHMQIALVIIMCSVLPDFCADTWPIHSQYALAIPRLDYSNSPRVLITTPSWDPVNVNVIIPGLGFTHDTTVSRYNHADITLSNSVHLIGTGKHNKTIIISSSDIISVHCMDNENRHGDGFLALPSSQLGTEYRVVSYQPYSTSYPSFVCISALDKETSVTIKTSAGQDHFVELKPYESYRLDGGAYEDLTGTVVQTNYPVSAISGIATQIPSDKSHKDGLLEQLLPLHSWGREFIMAPFMKRTSGYIYRVLSANQTTTLSISNQGTIQLQPNTWYEGDVTDDTIVVIASDQPVSVAQYSKGATTDDILNGGPSMILIPTTDLNLNNVTFPVFEWTYNVVTYIINVIIRCEYVPGLEFDESISMEDWSQLESDDNTVCAVRGIVDTGVHSVAHSNPSSTFMVTIYSIVTNGFQYAYLAGIKDYSEPSVPTTPSPTLPSPKLPINGLYLRCEGTNMTTVFNYSAIPFSNASDVHLWDTSCVASPYGSNQAIITTNYNKCQTAMEQSDGHIMFRNALILDTDDPASPLKPLQVEIECQVERRQMAETSFLSNLKKHISFGNFTFNLDIFPDKTYSAPYNPDDYPVDVKFGDDLYLAASVTTVNDLELLVDSCWGTPSTDPWHDTSYSLINDGCPDDESVTFFESGDRSIQQFTFKAFAFKGDSWLVFIHCQLLVCDANTPNSRCAQGCVDQSGINSPRMRRSNYDLHTVTSRPLVVRG